MFSTVFKNELSTLTIFFTISILLYSAEASKFSLKACAKCTDADRARCPEIVPGPNCEVIQQPNCGCCKMCAKKVGENCGVATGFCEKGLECVPPPMTPEQYRDYGPANYFLEASLGEFVCVTFEHFLEILTGAAYEQGDETGTDEGTFIPELYTDFGEIAQGTGNHHDKDHSNSEVIPELQNLNHLNPFKTTNNLDQPQPVRPVEPPVSPFQNSPEPCLYHADQVWGKDHFDHHEWVPSCKDGFYFPEQCELTFGLERGRCWCVDKMGNPLSKFIPGEDAHPELCLPEFNHKS